MDRKRKVFFFSNMIATSVAVKKKKWRARATGIEKKIGETKKQGMEHHTAKRLSSETCFFFRRN